MLILPSFQGKNTQLVAPFFISDHSTKPLSLGDELKGEFCSSQALGIDKICNAFLQYRLLMNWSQKMVKKHPIPCSAMTVKNRFSAAIATSMALATMLVFFLTSNARLKPGNLVRSLEWEDSKMGCDLFSGKWVFDNVSYPLYSEKECSFMSDQLACEKFGRENLEYQNWRWQPNDCNLPR